jgi:cephalosporin hydroxylase
VRALVQPGQRTLVILDSNHSYAHVLAELQAYAGLVTPGSYIVATDGIMQDLADVPRGQPGWTDDNPTRAAFDFVRENPQFVIEQPQWPFNESELASNITHWPGAWLRRVA